ncbi:hypothetical protein B9T31_04765 [Acinetobacter sp. ANC 4558]|uniref:EcsC family protein n=1 Tax=Acinetobacter sp. ANC 4558 TaxID=1977876 RepID=UPI000A3353E8|nr:EcsC family protein [Acinetobacter sp. ANC 4558]OTG86932.1 hypothetical protein B9T31_04765 [Acinetobacter sp. ANC 4558]
MGKSNKNPNRGFLSNALGVAKKLSNVGLELINQSHVNQVQKESGLTDATKNIEGIAHPKNIFDVTQNEAPQQILRNYVPLVTQQVLGRHYSTINKVTNVISPQLSDKVSDYFFDRLNNFTNQISSVDSVLDQAGISDLEELTQDRDRSKRLSQALVEQNKWIASIQGALTGATGVIGSSIDIPVSIVLALKTIYQVGRSYGFELNEKDEQDIIQYIFKQVNLGILAEKHTLLVGLRAISRMLETHDVYQLQQLLGSSNDIEIFKKWFENEQGEVKWDWLNTALKFSALRKLTPIVGATISASYSWTLIEDVNEKAQEVFSNARQYLIQHKDVSLSVLSAYEKSLHQFAQAIPSYLSETSIKEDTLVTDFIAVTPKKVEQKTQQQVTAGQTLESDQHEHLTAMPKKEPRSVSKTSRRVKTALGQESVQTAEKVQQVRKKPVKRVTKKTEVDNANE